MKLVEIIRVLDGTNDNTYEALVQFVKDIDKVGVTCKVWLNFLNILKSIERVV
jgi:3-hydroxyacyl-CoA dehydrogenase